MRKTNRRSILLIGSGVVVALFALAALFYYQTSLTTKLNFATQQLLDSASQPAYYRWKELAIELFGNDFSTLSAEQQLQSFDQMAARLNTTSLLKLNSFKLISTKSIVEEKPLAVVRKYTSLLPSPTVLVTHEGQPEIRTFVDTNLANGRSLKIQVDSEQEGKPRIEYIGQSTDTGLGRYIESRLKDFTNELEKQDWKRLLSYTDLDITKDSAVIKNRLDIFEALDRVEIDKVEYSLQKDKFELNLRLTQTGCPLSFSLTAEYLPDLDAYFFYGMSSLVKDLCNDQGKVPLSCIDCRYAPVDKVYQLSEKYISSVVETRLPGNGSLLPEVKLALTELFVAAKQAGAPAKVFSAYRSHENQVNTFQYWLNRELNRGLSPEAAYISANQYSALPGHSEHQLGTTVDLGCETCTAFDNSMGNRKVYEFLAEHAHEFGFVISYPQNTTQFTGYTYEPWHIRYIGKQMATEIFNLGYLNGNGIYLAKFLREKGQF